MSIIINKYFYSLSPHVKKAKTVLDSGFHAMDSGFQVLKSWFFVSGTWILDTNPYFDSEFLELYSGFQRPGFQIAQQKLEGFRIPHVDLSRLCSQDAGNLLTGMPKSCCRNSCIFYFIFYHFFALVFCSSQQLLTSVQKNSLELALKRSSQLWQKF